MKGILHNMALLTNLPVDLLDPPAGCYFDFLSCQPSNLNSQNHSAIIISLILSLYLHHVSEPNTASIKLTEPSRKWLDSWYINRKALVKLSYVGLLVTCRKLSKIQINCVNGCIRLTLADTENTSQHHLFVL